MKKIISLVLAVAMVICLCTVSAFAAEDYVVDMDNLTTNHDSNVGEHPAHGYAGVTTMLFDYGDVVTLGNLDLGDYDACEITYATDMGYVAQKPGMKIPANWALKNNSTSIGAATQDPNEDGLLGKADCVDASVINEDGANWDKGERVAVIDLSGVDYSGDVFLSHFNSEGNQGLLVGIKFVAKAQSAGGLRDFDTAGKGDKMSYDQILVNGAEIANGNDAVIAAKVLVDGSDGSIQNVAMHGWYGNANSKIDSFGYMIDDGEPVYGDFKVATTQDVIDAGGESRFTIVIDVTSLTDGETHKIQALAKLQNGDIVKLNRNADGKDRDAYVNYKAQLVDSTPNYALHGASFDTIYVNDVMNFGKEDGKASEKLDEVGRKIDGSDGSVQTIRIRGWIGFETEIAELGYQINGKNTFGDYKVAPEAAVVDPTNGGQYATRFDMTIDVSNLKGTNKIVAVAKLADGTIVKIDENVKANGAGTTPNTSFTYVGPADENVQTGDMSVAMFAVLAVLALGAAVVFAKKRSF